MNLLILGIDDAGRGPVIGPMVLAGCLIRENAQKELKKLGVKDSKQLTPRRREFLERQIRKLAEKVAAVKISPKTIDQSQEKGIKLNEVEAIACAKIINKLNDGKEKIKVFLDCPSSSLRKWSELLRTKIKNLANLEIHCEHKADKNHVSVSAASIIAKCIREREMKKLKEKYGEEMGSGYPSDPLTISFLEKKGRKYKDKGIFRKSWITWQRANAKAVQKKLF